MICKSCNLKFTNKTAKKNSRNGKIYIRTLCKKCISQRREIYRNENKLLHKDHILKHKFGISLMDYQFLELSQDKKCAICRIGRKNKYFNVDHDHRTGKIRGLLCDSCNLLLGKAKDSIKVLTNAINYLEK